MNFDSSILVPEALEVFREYLAFLYRQQGPKAKWDAFEKEHESLPQTPQERGFFYLFKAGVSTPDKARKAYQLAVENFPSKFVFAKYLAFELKVATKDKLTNLQEAWTMIAESDLTNLDKRSLAVRYNEFLKDVGGDVELIKELGDFILLRSSDVKPREPVKEVVKTSQKRTHEESADGANKRVAGDQAYAQYYQQQGEFLDELL